MLGFIHSTKAYRLNLTVTYPTEHFLLDTNSPYLHMNGIPVLYTSTTNHEDVTVTEYYDGGDDSEDDAEDDAEDDGGDDGGDVGEDDTVTVAASADMLVQQDLLIIAAFLTAKTSVVNAESYTVSYNIEWHEFPYGVDGGHSYNMTGEETIQIKTSEVSIVYSTSDENTPCNIVQIQEYITMNVSVTLPEVS